MADSVACKTIIVGDGAIGKVCLHMKASVAKPQLIMLSLCRHVSSLASPITPSIGVTTTVCHVSHVPKAFAAARAALSVACFYPLVTPADEPTTFNNFNLTWEQEGEEGVEALELELWDTAGDSTSAYL